MLQACGIPQVTLLTWSAVKHDFTTGTLINLYKKLQAPIHPFILGIAEYSPSVSVSIVVGVLADPHATTELIPVLFAHHSGRVVIEDVGTQETPSLWSFNLDKVVVIADVSRIWNRKHP